MEFAISHSKYTFRTIKVLSDSQLIVGVLAEIYLTSYDQYIFILFACV